MPYALLSGLRQHGWKGGYLALAVFVFKRLWMPMEILPGIRLTNWREAANYLDNFVLNELRQPEVEKLIRETEGEVIEAGVNVGITTRWWLALNPAVHVIGLDMMQESLDYTGKCIGALNQSSRWHPVVGAVGDSAGQMTVTFDDPLEGTNSLDNLQGGIQRTVEVNTVDAYLQRAPLRRPLLFKLDIEGHAAAALRGASRLLQTVRWVVVEIHHEEELSQSAALLTEKGFGLRHFHGRTMWWARLD
ncbi:FkbM family methyltransferase [Prosthecobacter fusiformis]|nr:FkbM family methyltransferase [Prosthecobacter fusiformis]